jgi:hypothetical protein
MSSERRPGRPAARVRAWFAPASASNKAHLAREIPRVVVEDELGQAELFHASRLGSRPLARARRANGDLPIDLRHAVRPSLQPDIVEGLRREALGGLAFADDPTRLARDGLVNRYVCSSALDGIFELGLHGEHQRPARSRAG